MIAKTDMEEKKSQLFRNIFICQSNGLIIVLVNRKKHMKKTYQFNDVFNCRLFDDNIS